MSGLIINNLLKETFGDATYTKHQQQVHKRFNDYDIYSFFIGEDIGIQEVIRSPLRTDINETFNIFYPSQSEPKWPDQILFKDFNGDTGNVFKFVKKWAIHNDGGIYLDSLESICNYILDKMTGSGVISRKVPAVCDTSKSYQIIRTQWNDFYLSYWEDIGVNQSLLECYRTSPVEYLLDEKGLVVQNFSNTQTYAYVIFDKFKLYQPNEENFRKFFNQCPPNYMQGYEQCREGASRLTITKSLKDILVYQAHTPEWENLIAPHGEGYNLGENWVWWILQHPVINIIYDFDLAGVKGANRIRKQLRRSRFYSGNTINVKFVSTKRNFKRGRFEVAYKDISDYRIVLGGEATTERINKLFND